MTTPAARALEQKARIAQLAQDLADLLYMYAAETKSALAFTDSRTARRIAIQYTPQASILDSEEPA